MSNIFVDLLASFRLNSFMTPPDPTNPAAFQNVTLTKGLRDAAKEVVSRYRVLFNDLNDRTTTSDIVADFEFQSEDQAKRGELLLCEILARANPDVVNDVIAAFPVRVALILDPVTKSLNEIIARVSQNQSTLKNLLTLQLAVKKTQDGVTTYIKDIKQQAESQSWERVATTCVEMNRFLERMKGLRSETNGVENDYRHTPGSKPLRRLPTHPIEDVQIGHVVRTGSVVRVSFDLYFDSWPAKFCQDIANTVNITCPFPAPVAVMDLDYRFDGLLNQCGSLTCRLLDDEKYPPVTLSDIESHFTDFLSAQASFCQQMQLFSNKDTGSAPSNEGTGTSLPVPPVEIVEQLKHLLENFVSVANSLTAEAVQFAAISDQLDSRTAGLAKTIEPLTKIYAPAPELADLRKKAIGKGVPDIFYDWVIIQFNSSSPTKMPSKGDAFRQFGPQSYMGSKLEGGGKGQSTLAKYLGIIRAGLVDKGYLAGEAKGKALIRARGYDPSGDRHEDINQLTPYDQAADLDDAAHPGLTERDTRSQELGDGQEE